MTRISDRASLAWAATVVASAVGGAIAGCHPTGYLVPDALWSAAFAGALTALASVANRGVLLIAAAAAVALSRRLLLLPALAGVIVAFVGTLPRRPSRVLGALTGALIAQVALRWPAIGFFGSTAVAAGGVAALLLAAAWPHLTRKARATLVYSAAGLLAAAVVVSLPSMLGALLARAPAVAAEGQARAALSSVENDQAPDAVASLHSAAAGFATAHARADAWWTWGGSVVPGVALQHRAVARLTAAGSVLASAASHQAGQIDLHHLRGLGGAVDLPALERLRVPVSDLDREVGTAAATASSTRSGWLLGPIGSPLSHLQTELSKASRSLHLASLALRDVPSLLGSTQPRNYLAVFMTPAETRGLGGFFGSYAQISASGGTIKVVRTGLPKQLVDPSGSPRLTGPADYLERYGSFDPQDHLEDASYSPDFPTVASVLAQLYPQMTGVKLDGVIALDPYALADLLKFTGPISVPGLPAPLTSTNAADVLIRTQYLLDLNGGQAERHDILSEALSTGFNRLMKQRLPSPKAMGATLGGDVKQGRLMLWTSDARFDPLVSALGLTGQFPSVSPSAGGLFGLTLANAANNKMDAYLHMSVTSDTKYDPRTGSVSMNVNVTLANRGSATLPEFVAGSFAGSGLPVGTDLTWLSVYNTWPLVSATLDGRPLQLSGPQPELGTDAYSGLVPIPPLSSATLHLSFQGRKAPGPELSQTIRLQPLANPTEFRMTATATHGWNTAQGTSATWKPSSSEIQTHTWKYEKAK